MCRRIAMLGAAAAVTLSACSLDLTNPNQPTVTSALTNPRAATSLMIAGVLATYRDLRAAQIRAFGSFGRETYFMFLTDGRFITGPYRDWALNTSFEAGTQWGGVAPTRYGNYRNARAAMQVINNAPNCPTPCPNPVLFTAAEKAGALGVLKTSIALDMLHVIEARGAIGAVVDMTDDINAALPFVSEDSVYKWISAMLDDANTNLIAAGTTPFYFPMHDGFGAFGVTANTPAGFNQFNRALKARVEVKRGSLGCGAPCYTTALTALGGTWIANLTSANRDNGVYVVYSTAAGDALNTIAWGNTTDPHVHPSIDSITGVATDSRYRRKVAIVGNAVCDTTAATRTESGVTSTHRPCTYPSNVSPIPIIRNEELILLRAEAEWFTGNTVGGTADLALVRDSSGSAGGGVAAVKFAAPTTADQFTQELLLQRTLSLYQEAQRWVDYRRLGHLADLGTLSQDVTAGFTVAPYSVLPLQECLARARVGNPGGIPRSCPGGPP
ncbi:MAG TPA: RagB/SusD family nutrient uptake outer membrane protein [Gemmatimonadales bacterium]|nr:RagB/SusD family nutrient uptake outer membrane protein [Gemmatimonadales bacterium]